MFRRLLNRLLGSPPRLSARVQLSPAVSEEPPSELQVRRANKELHEQGFIRSVSSLRLCAGCGRGRDAGPLFTHLLSADRCEWRHEGCLP